MTEAEASRSAAEAARYAAEAARSETEAARLQGECARQEVEDAKRDAETTRAELEAISIELGEAKAEAEALRLEVMAAMKEKMEAMALAEAKLAGSENELGAARVEARESRATAESKISEVEARAQQVATQLAQAQTNEKRDADGVRALVEQEMLSLQLAESEEGIQAARLDLAAAIAATEDARKEAEGTREIARAQIAHLEEEIAALRAEARAYLNGTLFAQVSDIKEQAGLHDSQVTLECTHEEGHDDVADVGARNEERIEGPSPQGATPISVSAFGAKPFELKSSAAICTAPPPRPPPPPPPPPLFDAVQEQTASSRAPSPSAVMRTISSARDKRSSGSMSGSRVAESIALVSLAAEMRCIEKALATAERVAVAARAGARAPDGSPGLVEARGAALAIVTEENKVLRAEVSHSCSESCALRTNQQCIAPRYILWPTCSPSFDAGPCRSCTSCGPLHEHFLNVMHH